MRSGELEVRLASLKQASSSTLFRSAIGRVLRSWSPITAEQARSLEPACRALVARGEASRGDLSRLLALLAELD